MVLIDTNVLAYLLIAGEHTAAAQELWRRDSDWRSEAFVLIEFSNVLAHYVSLRRLRPGQAQKLLWEASHLLANRLARISHAEGLSVATRFRISAYDARFLALADQTRSKLVTEDATLRAAAPTLTHSLGEAIATV